MWPNYVVFTAGFVATVARAGFLTPAGALENVLKRHSNTRAIDCTQTVECQVLTTLQPCIDVNVTCTCTEANEQNLQLCFNCLFSEEPSLPQINQTTITSDITELVSDFNSQCSSLGIPTLTFPTASAANTGISSPNPGSGGSDPPASAPAVPANPAGGSTITNTPGSVNTNLPQSTVPEPSPPAVAPLPSPNPGQVTILPSSAGGSAGVAAPSAAGIQGQKSGSISIGNGAVNGLVLGAACALALGL